MDFFEQEYQQYRIIPSDINENLHYLYELALTCNHVTEMGVRSGISTRAFLNTNVRLISYDFEQNDSVSWLFAKAHQHGKNVAYVIADVRKIEIEETDFLFIDTWHCYEQLKTELALHHKKVRKYIAFHDTQTYGLVAENNYSEVSESGLGLLPAIIEFMSENPEWKFKKHVTNNNGLTIIEKIENVQVIEPKKDEVLNPIPVIGVPIVNGVHWLERLVNSIDYPVEELCVINNNGRGELGEDLYFLSKQKNEFIGKITICTLPSNIGCAGAWNLIIKSYLMKPYWVICNHDIAFTPGYLKEMALKAMDSETGMVFSEHQEWCLFLLKDWVVQQCGLFDENFYPAYCEDIDYAIRVQSLGIKCENVMLPYLHGDKGYKESGSQTWRTDMSLYPKIEHAHNMNHEYMAQKWGSEWKEKEWQFTPNRHPFDNDSLPISTTTYDIGFLRQKHFGF